MKEKYGLKKLSSFTSFKTILFIFLILICRFRIYALPDLTLNSSDIIFSNQNPEVKQSITISIQVSNTGDAYGSQVTTSPVSSFTTYGTSDSYRIHITTWHAQYFVAPEGFFLGSVSLLIEKNSTSTEEAILQIRADGTTQTAKLKPVAGLTNYISSATVVYTSPTPSWQTFNFIPPIEISEGVTYWLCMGSTATHLNRYRWWFAEGATPDGITMSTSTAVTWYDVTQTNSSSGPNLIGFYKVFPTFFSINIYDGNPLSGGSLIYSKKITSPINNGESTTISFSWEPPSEGTHNIYVVVDNPDNINESNESNNTAYNSISVSNSYPSVSSTDPADGSVGIDISIMPRITFSEALDDTTVSTNTITLTAVQNNLGETTGVSIPGIVVYNSALYRVTFIPASYLDYNYTYRLSISKNIKDIYDHPLQADYTSTFTTVMNDSQAHIVKSADGTTQISIPSGAVGIETYYIDLQTEPEHTDPVVKALQKISGGSFPSLRTVSDALRSFNVYASSYPGTLQSSINFASPVTITIPYTDNGDGTVQGMNPPVQEHTLAIYSLNETDNLWIKLPGSQVDTVNDRVTTEINHFSHFILIGQSNASLSQTYAYPVPFKPNADPTHTSIKFTGLSARATIKIYTITGELVKTIYETDGDGFNDTWDAHETASGMYIYVIDNGKEQKTGQLLIIK